MIKRIENEIQLCDQLGIFFRVNTVLSYCNSFSEKSLENREII